MWNVDKFFEYLEYRRDIKTKHHSWLEKQYLDGSYREWLNSLSEKNYFREIVKPQFLKLGFSGIRYIGSPYDIMYDVVKDCKNYRFIIEVKKIFSPENKENIYNYGKLRLKLVGGYYAENYLVHIRQDSIAQLRSYALIYGLSPENTIPIFTDGERIIVFRKEFIKAVMTVPYHGYGGGIDKDELPHLTPVADKINSSMVAACLSFNPKAKKCDLIPNNFTVLDIIEIFKNS